jgi:flagellar hook-associated protein 1
MPGLIQGLETARRALLAQQAALNVTGNNVANASTPGYTRQKAILEPTPSERTPDGIIGTGVQMTGVQRARDIFLDVQVRDEMGLSGKWQARADILTRVESILNEPGDTGVGALFDQFWNAWLDLSNQPEDSAARSVVVQRGQALAQGLQQLDQRVREISDATDTDLKQRVQDLNSSFEQMAALNAQIANSEVGGNVDAALRDTRDLLVDKLAQDTGATTLLRGDGTLVVRVGGRTVVEGDSTVPLTTQEYNDGGHVRIRVLFGNDKNAPTSLSETIAGQLEVRDQVLPQFMDQINELATNLISSVNRLHQAGPSRLPFFRGTRASNIEVAPDVAKDVSQVNASTSGDPGDNDIAVAIASLRDARTMDRGTSTMADFYRSSVTDLGALTQQAKTTSENQATAVQTLDNQRQAVIGVNLDEELTRMITTQKAYEAAARVFSTVSSMLDTMLQM